MTCDAEAVDLLEGGGRLPMAVVAQVQTMPFGKGQGKLERGFRSLPGYRQVLPGGEDLDVERVTAGSEKRGVKHGGTPVGRSTPDGSAPSGWWMMQGNF